MSMHCATFLSKQKKSLVHGSEVNPGWFQRGTLQEYSLRKGRGKPQFGAGATRQLQQNRPCRHTAPLVLVSTS